MVICLKQGADLNMAQLMPLPLTVSCFNKIQIGFTFLVPAHLGSPGQRAVKRVCVLILGGTSRSSETTTQTTEGGAIQTFLGRWWRCGGCFAAGVGGLVVQSYALVFVAVLVTSSTLTLVLAV